MGAENKIVINLPRLRWQSFLSIRFLFVIASLCFCSMAAYWYQNIRPYLWINGAHVEAFSTILSSDMAGRITEMGPQVGDFVKKGQPLFAIDRDLLLAKQRQAQFAVDSLSNKIEAEKERVGKAMESYLTAANELDLGAGSAELVNKQLLAMDEAQEKSEEAKALLAQAQKELAMIDLELKKTAFVCPFDAVVLKRSENLGAVVSFGDPIYTICKPDYLWLEAEVLEEDLGKIALGTKAKIHLIAYPDREFAGTVSYIGPATVAKSDNLPFSAQKEVLPIKISIENLDKRLKPGLSAKVALKVH